MGVRYDGRVQGRRHGLLSEDEMQSTLVECYEASVMPCVQLLVPEGLSLDAKLFRELGGEIIEFDGFSPFEFIYRPGPSPYHVGGCI